MTPEQQIACGMELYVAVRDWMEADDIDGEGWREMTSTARAFVAALDEMEAE